MTFGWPRIHIPVLESTMPIAASLAVKGIRHGTVVTCDFQSKGVGRRGHDWHAPMGSSLLAGIVLQTCRLPDRLPLLSLLVAEAVAVTVETFGATAQVKWPNDVWVDHRKISGILLRSSPGPSGTYVIVGIGLNLRTSAEPDASATSIETISGTCIGRDALLDVLMPNLERVVNAFEADDLEPVLASIRARLALLDELVALRHGDGIVTGMLHGVADDGRLLVQIDDRTIMPIASGEIERGPRRAGTISS